MHTHFHTLFAQALHSSAVLAELSYDSIYSLIEVPPTGLGADLAFPCFSLAKSMRLAPPVIASSIYDQLRTYTSDDIIFSCSGPYINLSFGPAYIARWSWEVVQDHAMGHGETKHQTLLIEGRQPNTHKALHVGHLRNALVSEAVCRIAEYAGYTVHRACYIGDIGAHVAKWIWYYTQFDNSPIPTYQASLRAGALYVQAGVKIAENPDLYKAQVHEIQRLLEAGDSQLVAIRQQTRAVCLDDMRGVFGELGCQIDHRYYESDVEQPGIQMVQELSDSGRVAEIHPSQGAIIADLESHDLGVFVLLKSNGTSLYSTKDIALAYRKQQNFQFDESVYIVATEQLHHFNQLFKTLDLIGYTPCTRHVAYEMVELEGGKMSSRDGTVVLYHELRDALLAKSLDAMTERPGTQDAKHAIARAVTFGSMAFSMLAQDTYKKIIFDMNRATSFDGETGAYIQYTYARCQSIIRKYDARDRDTKLIADTVDVAELLVTDEDKRLFVHLTQFASVVQTAASEYRPNLVARFALELCHHANSYYQHNYMLDTANPVLSHARVSLITVVVRVLGQCMDLVCVPRVEEM